MTAPIPGNWNPRFAAYARAHRNNPEDQLEIERSKPYGCMVDYSRWLQRKIREFDERLTGRKITSEYDNRPSHTDSWHQAFDEWLWWKVEMEPVT